MKSHLLGALSASILTLTIVTSANADFSGRLETSPGSGIFQAYYDDQLDITWARNANINGLMNWYDATSWVSTLDIGGVTGWRLPNMDRDGDGSIMDCGSGAISPELCKDNENGFMYWQNGITSSAQSPFFNVQPDAYWSGTEELIGEIDGAWNLIFNASGGGDQGIGNKTAPLYAWAVYGGDVAAADTDGDGVIDSSDNCILIANPMQRDTDFDDYGNFCDPDFDNNLIVNAADLAFFKTKFFSTDPDADLNGNGIVNAADLAILKTMFFQPPGPSYVDLPPPAIGAPTLKWAYGGCTSWCEHGWFSSPAVADLDNDNKQEIIAGGYTLHVLNGEDGSVQWQLPQTGYRIWPGVIVDDIDNDLDYEIVIGKSSGNVIALTHTGSTIWDTTVSFGEVRSLSVFDLDNDNTAEIVAGLVVSGDSENTWVFEHDGNIRTGWPQLDGTTSSFARGIYNSNIAVGDIDNDNLGEIYVPSDTLTITAYNPDGSEILANALYGTGALWGMVLTYESSSDEIQGWTSCTGARDYHTNFSLGPAVIADIDNNAELEIVVIGNTQTSCDGVPESKYNGVYIFNKDRTRFSTMSYDWTTPPLDITGIPLIEDYNVIESGMPNPAVADLDGDGQKEIIFSSYDGKVHALWLDKTEHGNWPYSIYQASEGFYRLSGEPLVADLNNDGAAEVIVASWTEKGSNANGKLHILDNQGNMLFEIILPDSLVAAINWNGALAAPTLANVDDDTDFELVLNTVNSGVVVYDLPGTKNAKILWGTGRGNYLRNGYLP